MTRNRAFNRSKLLVFLGLVGAVVLFSGVTITNSIRATNKSQLGVDTELTDSSTTDDVGVDIISLDDSRLASSGDYVILAKIRGADFAELSLDDQTVSQTAVTNDGGWHDVKLKAHLTEAGKYQLRLTAVNNDPTIVSEKIINVTVPALLTDSGDQSTIALTIASSFVAVVVIVALMIVYQPSKLKTRGKH